jgi:N-acetyltransferase 10
MGYGSRALDLLEKYYEHNMVNVDESNDGDGDSFENSKEGLTIINEDTIGSLKEMQKTKKLRLFWKLNERKPERLDYLGVSFGLTGPLLKFWKKSGYVPVYLRYSINHQLFNLLFPLFACI